VIEQNINIVEVGPRDGLQNEKEIVPTDVKIEFINRLLSSGLSTIETTSFVSPKWVPQMADHEQVVSQLPKNSAAHFPVLVPNQKGLDNALRYQINDIAVFAAASETFSQKNINRSIDESLQEYSRLIQQALQAGMRVRGYVSCVLGCPYEGKIALSQVVKVASTLFQAGCYEISLGDTIGVGTPLAAKEMVKSVMTEIPSSKLAVHYHDTYGMALANIFACLDLGIATVDSSVAGLGGCPYAKGATGNVATEEVVYLLHGLGCKTGVDLEKLIQAGEYICHYLKHANRSKVAVAMLAKKS
jgi:hydroxymethylglutaryl-CoA lyase